MKNVSIFKKCGSALLALALCLAFFGGCGKPKAELIPEIQDYAAPYSAANDGGKSFIKNRAGGAVPLLSTQITADIFLKADKRTAAQLEPYFAVAALSGFNAVDIPIMWSQVEPAKDEFKFDDLRVYLDYAKKYALKVNLLWYGSLRDGESRTYSYPAYIYNSPRDYTVIKDLYDAGIYGRVRILKWDDPDLLRRESLALYKTMNFIGEWNAQNNGYDPVVTLQIGQGAADRFYRWRIDQYDVQGAEGKMTEDEAFGMLQGYIGSLAAAVKKSAYRPLVRLEYCEQTAVTSAVTRVKEIEGVDIVAPTYLHTVANTKAGITGFAGANALAGMPVLNAENWASDISYRNLLATFALGGIGYTSYVLAPANYFVLSPDGAVFGRMNEQAEELNDKFTQVNTRADDTKRVMDMLAKAPYSVCAAPAKSFLALGMDNLVAAGGVQKSFVTAGDVSVTAEYTVPADQKALGYAIAQKEGSSVYLYAISSAAAKFVLGRANILTASSGAQNAAGDWTAERSEALGYGNTGLDMEANRLYRFKLSGVSGSDNKWMSENGYKSAADSLRG